MSTIADFDPFDLPDWVGGEEVVWVTETALRGGPHVRGHLRSGAHRQELDLLAVDAAFPNVVCPSRHRHDAHQAWHYGEVLLVTVDNRVTAGVPGVDFDAGLACETLRRVARAVGSTPGRFTVSLTL